MHAETANANGLEPCAYFRYVLERFAAADTVKKIEALRPWNMPTLSVQEG